MKVLWVAVLALGLNGGCFGKYKKGIVTTGTDSFSGAAEVKWNGWFLQTTAPGAGVQMIGILAGAGSTVTNVDTTLTAGGPGQPKATMTAKFGMVATEGTSFKNESSIPWQLKNCTEIEVKVGEGPTMKIPATWDGQVSMGDPQETIKAEIPAEALAGLETQGVLAVRACGTIAASTEKQISSLKEWAAKAALKPAPKPAAPASTSAPANSAL
jgi:hypothetical protein